MVAQTNAKGFLGGSRGVFRVILRSGEDRISTSLPSALLVLAGVHLCHGIERAEQGRPIPGRFAGLVIEQAHHRHQAGCEEALMIAGFAIGLGFGTGGFTDRPPASPHGFLGALDPDQSGERAVLDRCSIGLVDEQKKQLIVFGQAGFVRLSPEAFDVIFRP